MVKHVNFRVIAYTLAGVIAFFVGMLLSPVNQFAAGFVILFSAIGLYFFIVLGVADRNWMDIRAVFSGVWMATIGLAVFRLAEYQEVWKTKTWLLMIAAFVAFQIGSSMGIQCGLKLDRVIRPRVRALRLGKIRFQMHENRLFGICVVTTLIGFACFSINVAIKGFIPCFSDDVYAYQNFYTKFHVFAVASTGVSGLCLYCIKTQRLAVWKKIVLLLCIFYLAFAFPIMIVSRGVFVVAALSLATTAFYLYRRRLIALVLSLVIILGVYLGVSNLRNYADDQLNIFFEPAKIITVVQNPEKETDPKDKETDNPENETSNPEKETLNPDNKFEEPEQNVVSFQLPPKVAFLYGYLTVSHDNLNEAVKNIQSHSMGVRQMKPFNVILRVDRINELNAQAENYHVNPYLNTTNLIGDFFYDFGIIGVAVFMLLWSFVFGINQGVYDHSNGIFALLALGNTMTPVALCFFATWMSEFNFWLFWGVQLLLMFAACITVQHKEEHR